MEIPRKIKSKQFIAIFSIMVMVFGMIHLLSGWFKRDATLSKNQETKKIYFPNAANADLQSIWVQKLEGKIKQQSEELKNAVKELEQQRNETALLSKQLSEATDTVMKRLEENKPIPMVDDSAVPLQRQESEAFPPPSFSELGTPSAPAIPIISHHFSLSENKTLTHKKESYIPAGSFVEAVILGGIDAAAGVSAQSEPRPVLLRLVDLTVLPNRFRKNIRDCHVVAAGYGDISTERAYIRTERLSCTLQNGDIFEQKIEAYLAGEDGKDGLRGTVVRREGDLVFNSFLAGTISGIGKGISQSFGTTSLSPLGSTKSLSGQDVLKSGLYGGAGEGGDQLQKYFIQRAEQMHPVIQISAGRTVTIVFLKGVELELSKTN